MPAFLPSELPVRIRTRHHWVVLFRPPHKILLIAFAVLLLAALLDPNPMAFILAVVFAVFAFLRWQTWRAEWLIITGIRIIRVQGVPETTSAETSLRLDRVSGARLITSVLGKLLDYGTIELEAPGQHPGVRLLTKIAHPEPFYLELRRQIFGEHAPGTDPDEDPSDYITEPLPKLQDSPWERFGRRRE